MDPTLTFDLVHAELSLDEFLTIVRQGIALFERGLDLARSSFCALPFVNC
jgi:hypothetical protein